MKAISDDDVEMLFFKIGEMSEFEIGTSNKITREKNLE